MKNTTSGNTAAHSTPKEYIRWVKRFALRPISNKEIHARALEVLSEMLKLKTAGQLTEAEKDYYRVLVSLVRDHEANRFPLIKSSPREVLKFLMEQNNLRQIDLEEEFGTQSMVSEFLSGKRTLTKAQIVKLSRRFGVSPSIWFDEVVTAET